MRHKVKHLHFVGIGGVGMSGIAELMANLNYQVSGSDIAQSASTDRLKNMGINIALGHSKYQIDGADAVVVSSAVDSKNPEVVAALEKGIPVVPRATMLVELMRLRQGIAVAGTHGKTTTTSLIASILAEADLDPTYVIGGRLSAAGENSKLGNGEFIVVEADESDASFLFLQPVLAVVTNIDSDHMATYDHNFANLENAFYELLQRLPFYGVAVLCGDDPVVRRLTTKINKPYVTYGFNEGCDFQAINVKEMGIGMVFQVRYKSDTGQSNYLEVRLSLPGRHNVQNALAAIAVCLEVGASEKAIEKALHEFKGVNRRFEVHCNLKIKSNDYVTLIDDYGHHPKEIEATLQATRGAFPNRRLLLVFQPHRYSRTRDCFEDFVRVLSLPDVLILTEVYGAGERAIVAADGRGLSRSIRLGGKLEPIFVEEIERVPTIVSNIAKANDVVLIMGAGSISELPKLLREKFSE